MHALDLRAERIPNTVGIDKNRFDEAYDALLDVYDGSPITVSFRDLVGPLPAYEGTHSLYPYPARLIRHIPRFVLNNSRIAHTDAPVLDPFCGSGTVLVEAQKSGRRSFGIDSNPIAALISRVKTTPLSPTLLRAATAQALSAAKRTRQKRQPPLFIQKWYSAEAVSALTRLSHAIELAKKESTYDMLRVILALTCRQVSQTDPRIPVPVRGIRNIQATTEDVWLAFQENAKRAAITIGSLEASSIEATVLQGDSRLPAAWEHRLATQNSVMITSPPYGAAQKYVRSTSLEAGWLGFTGPNGTTELEQKSIGRDRLSQIDRLNQIDELEDIKLRDFLETTKSINPLRSDIYVNYFIEMKRTFQNAILANPNLSTIVMIAGSNTVLGKPLHTHRHLASVIEGLGFEPRLILRDLIRGRTLLTSRRNGSAIALDEHMYIFDKVGANVSG